MDSRSQSNTVAPTSLSEEISKLIASDRPPNFIVILADDLGYGDLGAYGQKKIRTPRLDQMAAEGMRFTSFYAGHTVCAPSRIALLTGVDMAHSRTRSNAGPGLQESDITMAEILKGANYATGIFGKWGFGTPENGAPDRQGFDEFLGYLGHVHAHSYYTDTCSAFRTAKQNEYLLIRHSIHQICLLKRAWTSLHATRIVHSCYISRIRWCMQSFWCRKNP